jgi:hypothetical protein
MTYHAHDNSMSRPEWERSGFWNVIRNPLEQYAIRLGRCVKPHR